MLSLAGGGLVIRWNTSRAIARLRQRRMFLAGLALGGALGGVCRCNRVGGQPVDRDLVQGAVRGAVATAVEPVAARFARRCGDRRRAAEHRERRFGANRVGIVAGCGQQLSGSDHPDVACLRQSRIGCTYESGQVGLVVDDLGVELLVAHSQAFECDPSAGGGLVVTGSRA